VVPSLRVFLTENRGSRRRAHLFCSAGLYLIATSGVCLSPQAPLVFRFKKPTALAKKNLFCSVGCISLLLASGVCLIVIRSGAVGFQKKLQSQQKKLHAKKQNKIARGAHLGPGRTPHTHVHVPEPGSRSMYTLCAVASIDRL
jgi:hypothetical protein